MDEPDQPGTEQATDPALAEAAIPPPAPPAPPGRAHRVRGVLVSRAAGWVVAVALAGAVVALSVVLAAAPQGVRVQALAGPAAITEIPGPAVRVVPGTPAGPGQVQIHAVPVPIFRAWCEVSPGPRSFRVVLPATPSGKSLPRTIIVKPGVARLVPIVVCPPR